MAKDTRKKQQKAMKKRRKDKERRKERVQDLTMPNPRALIKGARKFPFYECWISAGWDQDGARGLVNVLVARKQPDQNIVFASFLLDIFCLGLKDTLYNAGFSQSKFRKMLGEVFAMMPPERCSPELAHQMIYECIDYAAQFGFKPHRDFKLAQHLLEPRGTLETPHKLTFGKDGKPLFINGPFDNVDAILAKLNRNPGVGNYHFMAIMGDPFDEFEEEVDYLMCPYFDLFPEKEAEGVEVVHIVNEPPIPDGDYALVELYCTNPECQSRHVMLQVAIQPGGETACAIDYNFDKGASMEDAVSPYSRDLLKHIKSSVLKDSTYTERLKKHYEEFRAAVAAPTDEQKEVLEEYVG